VHPEAARKAFMCWVSRLNGAVFGGNWRRKGLGVRWVLALEYTKRQTIHFHALVVDVGDARRTEAWKFWFERWGCARIEPVRSSDACRRYCSKYVVKGGELDLGGPELHTSRSQLRRFVERTPLYSQPDDGQWCSSYARGYLRPDEYLELKEAAARLGELSVRGVYA